MTEKENLEELIDWYRVVYTPQLVKGSNIDPERMKQNAAVLRDAVDSYRTWRGSFFKKTIEPPPRPLCTNCRFYVANISGRGTCHLDPPSPYLKTFVPVESTDWCGQFAQK